MSTMKWIPLLAAPLLCALALQAHAENFSKCRDEGGVVAYRSHACLAGETLVATLDPEPETRAPQREGESARSKTARATSKRSTVRPGRSRFASSRSRSPRNPRTRRNPCPRAKKARADFQRPRGIQVTMDALSRWINPVYAACT